MHEKNVPARLPICCNQRAFQVAKAHVVVGRVPTVDHAEAHKLGPFFGVHHFGVASFAACFARRVVSVLYTVVPGTMLWTMHHADRDATHT